MARSNTPPPPRPEKWLARNFSHILTAIGLFVTIVIFLITIHHEDKGKTLEVQDTHYQQIAEAVGKVSTFSRTDTGFIQAKDAFVAVYRTNWAYFPDSLQQEMHRFKTELDAYANDDIPRLQFQKAADSLNKQLITLLHRKP